MLYENVKFIDAIKSLASIAGVNIEDETSYDLIPSRKLMDEYHEDKIFMAIYESDIKKGIKPTWSDNKRMKLAVARMKGLKEKYGSKIDF